MTYQEPTITELRDLVSRRLDQRWEAFAAEHPNLAAAIQRVQLVDSTVSLLIDDPDYQAALEAAARDRVVLHLGGQLGAIVDRLIDRLLRL
ncbi:MAG: hypothetical protein GC159_14360 [Phycisphaera sp.]|nr:hypothetical protein [Phycisphaera sp.]